MKLALIWQGLAVLMACIDMAFGSRSKLHCYQCNVTHATSCTEDYLKPCPDGEDFDRCQTRVRKANSGERWVEKTCARGPCNLSWEEEVYLGMNCDYAAPTYDCVSCCKDDGCNTGHGNVLQCPKEMYIVTGSLALISSVIMIRL
ncbi:uncharacterized protein LOC135210562 [Macrobrachium nipponense]|uniref:uncharacterized protein LOC135210562 n=1 Tax=Macrobrachium nipponense TaxID=159736 RepID=UPI0030C828C0